MQNMLQLTKYPVNEIFYSISGEGLSAGQPAIFIRVAGCNLVEEGSPCKYCDTSYSWNYKLGKIMTVDEIYNQVKEYPPSFVIITGGEPLKYDLVPLIQKLTENSIQIEIETNGSLPIYYFLGGWSMDIKTISSGNVAFNNYSNMLRLRPKDQVKFVISNIFDFNYACRVINNYPTNATILFQPAWETQDPIELVEWIKSSNLSPLPRLSLQLHKILYGKDRRGV